jgi:hypothetical protein
MTPQELVVMQQAISTMNGICKTFGALAGFVVAWWLRGVVENWMCRGGLPNE